MAGRTVVIEFDDREAAQAFVEMNHLQSQLGFSIRAMFLKPKVFCQCPDKSRHDNRNWRKHPRFGLYLHTACGKPSIHHQRGTINRLQYVFGFNLLDKVEE